MPFTAKIERKSRSAIARSLQNIRVTAAGAKQNEIKNDFHQSFFSAIGRKLSGWQSKSQEGTPFRLPYLRQSISRRSGETLVRVNCQEGSRAHESLHSCEGEAPRTSDTAEAERAYD